MNPLKLFIFLFLLFFSMSVFSHSESESVDAILNSIMASQGVNSFEQINCSNITEHQFEELGDALMEQMHPGEAHETMDAMMGGEGSESLKAVHVSMGKSYLRCNGSSGMMGSSMMQGMMGSEMMQSMMGNAFSSGMPFWNYGYWSIWNILYALLLIGLIVLVFLGVFKFWKDVNKKEAKK